MEDLFDPGQKEDHDEIGVLFDQFNSMWTRTNKRDEALQKAHDELERNEWESGQRIYKRSDRE